jgi:hypothetical protein
MTCTRARELMAARWLGDETDSGELDLHLAGCAECSAENASLSSLWRRMGDMPAPEPSPGLDARWQSSLDSLLSAQKAVVKPVRSRTSWLASFWPKTPAWQVAFAAACLVAGVLAGSRLPRETGEIARLREEVASTRAMVTLSLLQQQSATERLRGVSYTGDMPSMGPQVVSALTDAVAHDASVNVRLAAIDALTKVSGSPNVLQSLTQSLPRQDSPLVQAALIDYLVDARDRKALSTLRQLSSQPGVNPVVIQRAQYAVQQLSH